MLTPLMEYNPFIPVTTLGNHPHPHTQWLNCYSDVINLKKNYFQGMKFLTEKGLLNHTVEDIALFLYVGELLDKGAIGDYLGEG